MPISTWRLVCTDETEVIAFTEIEEAVEICFFTGGMISPPDDDEPACFPWETGRYNFGDAPLDDSFNFGWVYPNLNLPPDASTLGRLAPGSWPRLRVGQRQATPVHLDRRRYRGSTQGFGCSRHVDRETSGLDGGAPKLPSSPKRTQRSPYAGTAG